MWFISSWESASGHTYITIRILQLGWQNKWPGESLLLRRTLECESWLLCERKLKNSYAAKMVMTRARQIWLFSLSIYFCNCCCLEDCCLSIYFLFSSFQLLLAPSLYFYSCNYFLVWTGREETLDYSREDKPVCASYPGVWTGCWISHPKGGPGAAHHHVLYVHIVQLHTNLE